MNVEEIRAAHRTGIGGTAIAAIAGKSTFGNAHSVYMDIMGLSEPSAPNERQEAGLMLEPAIAQWYEIKTKYRLIEPGLIRDKDCEFFIAHPDRLAFNGGDNPHHLVEIKNVGLENARQWGEADDDIPVAYNIQVQWYLGITGLEYADVAALIGGNDLRVKKIQRSDTIITALRRMAEEFWNIHIIPKDPPPIDGSEHCSRLISKLYPDSSDEEILADAESDRIAGLYLNFKALEKDNAEKAEKYANELKNVIGSAKSLKTTHGKFSWGFQRGSASYKEIAAELAGGTIPEELVEKHRGPGFRVFRAPRGGK